VCMHAAGDIWCAPCRPHLQNAFDRLVHSTDVCLPPMCSKRHSHMHAA
jgi:hypothetical protein